MHLHVPHKVTLVGELPRTGRTLVLLGARLRRLILLVVHEIHVAAQQLALAEGLRTLLAGKRLLVQVDEHVRGQMALCHRSVAAQLAPVALLAVVRLHVKLILVAIWQLLAATPASDRQIAGGVHVFDVNAQVSLSAACRRTEIALIDRLVHHAMDELVGLQRVGLRESRLADVALVLLLARVDHHVPLQLEHVLRGVGAVRALIRSLARMAGHVATQLGQLHAGVAALRALVRLLLGVLVARVPDQLAACGKGAIAGLALVRLLAQVRVHVVLQSHVRSEGSLADGTLIGLFGFMTPKVSRH